MENTHSHSYTRKEREPREIRREVTIQSLLESGAHFGTATEMWCPKMAPFIYGIRRGKNKQNAIYIINLESTIKMWKKARKAIVDNIANGGELLFVSTKDAVQGVVVEEASKVGAPYVEAKWMGGMLTNLDVIKRSIVKLTKLEDFVAKAESNSEGGISLNKKEILTIKRAIEKLVKKLGGVRNLKKPPTMVFITDIVKNRLALLEARKLGIPVVAMVDTNSDPAIVTHPIPANDDSNSSQALFIRCVADAIAEGQALLEAKRRAAQSAVELKEGPPLTGELVQSEPHRDVEVEVKRKKS